MTPLLQVRDLTKQYRNGVLANDPLSLDVQEGEVLGLLGPNGAGKTTLVSQVLGLRKPTSGTVLLDGVDVVRHPDAARTACSYQPQGAAPLEGLTPLEAVELSGRLPLRSSGSLSRRGGHSGSC